MFGVFSGRRGTPSGYKKSRYRLQCDASRLKLPYGPHPPTQFSRVIIVVEQTTAGDRLDPPFDVFLRRHGSERCTTVRSEEKPVSSTIEKLHTQNISVNRTDSIMFATRRVTAEIFFNRRFHTPRVYLGYTCWERVKSTPCASTTTNSRRFFEFLAGYR